MATVPFFASGYDEPVTTLRRRASNRRLPLLPILAVALALIAAACGPSAPATARPSSPSTPSAVPATPELTAVPGGAPTPVVGATVGPPTTTDTGFGRIWDELPASFPTLPGQQPAETGAGATSGSFAILNMDVATASQTMAASLRALGWTVEVGSALEDGTVVLDAGGVREGCAAEVRFTPLSGTVAMSVLYGADCPFG
jgi:hypothetical protein